jgi:hypothetical protein
MIIYDSLEPLTVRALMDILASLNQDAVVYVPSTRDDIVMDTACYVATDDKGVSIL